ncbi:hypothetical protein ABID82_002345 [Methylobacterium sp. PvP062]|uniref:Uncharacterized protein n=1 Tax=Methylobacterium radiotolerans TaxID=31998 RepID=A0ABV2NN74_9HYPH|nr:MULTISPECIES: hypothetical protein [unclassified Methylobacterium]MBP2495323.1 hypothetical protein [Methylobacterium sp. PvP105]MBP2504806.1 hypothetical protein [Methylobacterium sp. PvP109]MCX7335813.1 hypothetical protein [Hyphomicrobiales bacterium]
MSDDSASAHERAAIQYMMRRLDGFARGLGLDEAATRQIVMRIAADMPERSDEDRLESARRCLLASASA